MSVWFHGTNDKNSYESILKIGFRKGTYFTPHLDTALSYGGRYVFAVYFKDDPKHWEWITKKTISKSRILFVKKFSFKVIHFNKDECERIYGLQLLEDQKGKKICSECKGRGEYRLDKYKFRYIFEIGGGAFKTRKDPINVCKKCNGHGLI